MEGGGNLTIHHKVDFADMAQARFVRCPPFLERRESEGNFGVAWYTLDAGPGFKRLRCGYQHDLKWTVFLVQFVECVSDTLHIVPSNFPVTENKCLS